MPHRNGILRAKAMAPSKMGTHPGCVSNACVLAVALASRPQYSMAQIVNSRCVLAVRDLKVSTRYYTDVLGFSKDPIDAEGWSFLTRDTFRVMLGECPNEKPAGELGDHSYFAYWNVDDVDQFYQEIVARGALVISEPSDK